MSESRTELERYVRERPGSHFSAIVDALGQATGQVQHHLSRLVRADRVERATVNGQTHYYPPGYDDREKEVLALLRRESPREIVTRLLTEGEQRPDDLAARLELARSTIEYHLEHLCAVDVVGKRRDVHDRVTVHLVDAGTARRLLEEIGTGPPTRVTGVSDQSGETG